MKVDVLGIPYEILTRTEGEDPRLEGLCGYCDRFKRCIVLDASSPDLDGEGHEMLRKETLRHEIEHAFLYESGLGESWEHTASGHDETYLDWHARMFPRLLAAYKSVGAI